MYTSHCRLWAADGLQRHTHAPSLQMHFPATHCCMQVAFHVEQQAPNLQPTYAALWQALSKATEPDVSVFQQAQVGPAAPQGFMLPVQQLGRLGQLATKWCATAAVLWLQLTGACIWLQGIVMTGEDLSVTTVTDHLQCKSACDLSPGCVSWTFCAGKCHQKKTYGPPLVDPQFWSGLKTAVVQC